MKVDLYVRDFELDTVKFTKQIRKHLESLGCDVSILSTNTVYDVIKRVGGADFAVAIGGDGTILRAVGRMIEPIPIIGINKGTLGFLADVEPKIAKLVLTDIIQNGFEVEERTRIAVRMRGGYEVGVALNEVAIVSKRPARMVTFRIDIDGEVVQEFRADGLIISTPTGSTAYAMSAGGPIVDPLIEGFLIVPIAPHLLGSRPQMISGKRDVQIEVESTDETSLVIDGQIVETLKFSDKIRVSTECSKAKFVNIHRNFFKKVGDKLGRF